MEATKQVIVIRRDLKMRRGKEIAQGAHASMAWLTRELTPAGDVGVVLLTEAQRAWLNNSYRKVTVQVPGLEELREVYTAALAAGLVTHLVTDAGLTEFHAEETVTALAIGPDWESKIDAVTGGLELY
jgi:PTH2 family peptidyl-tRNA hydrolase